MYMSLVNTLCIINVANVSGKYLKNNQDCDTYLPLTHFVEDLEMKNFKEERRLLWSNPLWPHKTLRTQEYKEEKKNNVGLCDTARI